MPMPDPGMQTGAPDRLRKRMHMLLQHRLLLPCICFILLLSTACSAVPQQAAVPAATTDTARPSLSPMPTATATTTPAPAPTFVLLSSPTPELVAATATAAPTAPRPMQSTQTGNPATNEIAALDAPVPVPAPAPATGLVVHGGNLRSAPDVTPDTVLAQVCPDDRLIVLEEQHINETRWLRVRVAAPAADCVDARATVNTEGWVSSVLVAETGPDTDDAADAVVAASTTSALPLPIAPAELVTGTYTLDSSLKLPVNVSGAQLDAFIGAVYPESPLLGLGETWVQAGEYYRINPIYLMAHAIHSSQWGTSSTASQTHNLYNWGASATCQQECIQSYPDVASGIFAVTELLNRNYLSPGGSDYRGATLRDMQHAYADDPDWATSVVSYMNWVAEFLAIETLQATRDPYAYVDDVRLVQPACFQVVQAALSSYGKPYTQAAGRRTGPNSFDCSGLIWWSYRQAGITEDADGRAMGGSTYTQIFNGSRTECDLDDLDGRRTTCWAPGDLVFIRYPGGQHVSMYVGNGLFSDCYSQGIGCILHDISDNAFYRQYFWQARRVLEGCEGMVIDPEEVLDRPVLTTWDDTDTAQPGEWNR